MTIYSIIRLLRDKRGATAVEFSILAVPFLMIVFVTLELALIFAGELLVDQAAEFAGRQVRTGEVQNAALSKAEFEKIICGRISVMLDCGKMTFDLAQYDDFTEISADIPLKDGQIDQSKLRFQLAKPSSISALRVFYRWPVIFQFLRSYFAETKDGSNILVGVSVFRTEPY